MSSSIRRQRLLRNVQTGFVLLAMAALFVVVGFAFLGASGLAIVLGSSFLSLLVLGGQEVRVDPSRAQRLEAGEAPRLESILEDLSSDAGLSEVPEVYVIEAEEMNAAAFGRESKPRLAVTRPLLERLSDRELRAVVAHEVTHIAQHDLTFYRFFMMLQLLTVTVARVGWLMLLFFWPVLATSGTRLPPGTIALLIGAPIVSVLLQLGLSRSREYAADLGAVELDGDPEGLAAALEKIDRQQQQLWKQVLPVPQRRGRRESVLRSHPDQDRRIARLRELADEV
jgi:heat shock protein HtpX